MAKRIAVVNQKGGVGKTTSATNLAAYLATAGQRILLVDLDPQANATSAFGMVGTARRCVYGVLLGSSTVEAVAVHTEHAGLDIIPSCTDLVGAEVELAAQMAREFRLQRALDGGDDDYDLVLIDCPPSLGLLTINALTAATHVLVPVQCEYLALEGLTQVDHTLNLVRRNLNPHISLNGLILTMFDARTNLAAQVVEEVRRHYPQTFQTVIPRSVRLSEAPSHGKTILAYDPSSRGARAYEKLARELLVRLGLPVPEEPEQPQKKKAARPVSRPAPPPLKRVSRRTQVKTGRSSRTSEPARRRAS
jgi:chromosome partitioning protein